MAVTAAVQPTTETTAATTTRTVLLPIAIVAGWAGAVWNTLAGHGGDTELTARWLADHQHAWIAATYGTALNALGLIALLLAVCVLVRRRGSAWATAALVTGALGTALYAVASAVPMQMLGLGKQTVITPAQTTALIDYVGEHDAIQGGVAFPGFLLLLIAQIFITVALFRSRALPVWVPALFIAGAVIQVALAGGGPLTAVATIPQTVAMVAIGWFAYRKSARTSA
jgi:hypothetical protein